MEKIIGIYKVTNPSGHIYIGQSINILRRWAEYKNLKGCGVNTRIYHSLKKHGWDKHEFEILEKCLQEELNDREIHHIELNKSFNSELGMNLHSGGNNHKISEETREKLRTSHLGQKAWNEGLSKESDERLKAQGESHSKKMKGRKPSEEIKLKRLIARKSANYHHSEETKKLLSDAKMGNKVWLGKKHTEESKIKMRKPKLKNHEK